MNAETNLNLTHFSHCQPSERRVSQPAAHSGRSSGSSSLTTSPSPTTTPAVHPHLCYTEEKLKPKPYNRDKINLGAAVGEVEAEGEESQQGPPRYHRRLWVNRTTTQSNPSSLLRNRGLPCLRAEVGQIPVSRELDSSS